MDAPKFPYLNFAMPSGIVATYIGKIAVEWMSLAQWWQDLPWASFILLLIGIGIGQTWADLVNHNSQLRKWWRHYNRMFDLHEVLCGSEIVNEHERLVIVAKCKALKNMENVKVVLKCTLLTDSNKSREIASVEIETREHITQQQDFLLELANVPRELPTAGNPRAQLGGLRNSLPSLPEDGIYIFEVFVNERNGLQSFKVYVDFMMQGSRSSGRLSVLTEYDHATQLLIS